MQSIQYYCQISIKHDKVATLISCYARVCKFIWTNSKPSRFLFWHSSPPVSQSLLIYEIYRSYNDPPHSVGFLSTSDQLVAETSN